MFKKKALGKFKSNQNSYSLLGECKLAEPLQKTGNIVFTKRIFTEALF